MPTERGIDAGQIKSWHEPICTDQREPGVMSDFPSHCEHRGGTGMAKDSEVEIRRRAYDIWIREGSPAGRDREQWERASEELRAVACQPPALAEISMEELGQQPEAATRPWRLPQCISSL
ncbi:DUF2934 domain-containing protein [Rhizobium sp. WSM1325]|uniref:DUF2934 domain-containing protein n=1 Tax=Rhizobium sp. WSM1325 TaxID=3444086 RepID=UPI003D7C3203